jgi:hypothetical protein
MRRNTHFIVPASAFELECGSDALAEYTFGTRTARHLFCKVCGVLSFYRPRSNPDGFAVTLHCLDRDSAPAPADVDVRLFDGQGWEAAFEATGITACSKAKEM